MRIKILFFLCFFSSRDNRLAILINITADGDAETENYQGMCEKFSYNASTCAGTGGHGDSCGNSRRFHHRAHTGHHWPKGGQAFDAAGQLLVHDHVVGEQVAPLVPVAGVGAAHDHLVLLFHIVIVEITPVGDGHIAHGRKARGRPSPGGSAPGSRTRRGLR